MESAPAASGGQRVYWEELPGRLRSEVEGWLGSPVIESRTQVGRFSPGAAARLRTRDGRRVFLKAVGRVPNAGSPDIHRQEALVAANIPPSAPVPALLRSWDLADSGWVALAFEDIDGRQPTEPWEADELARVVAALDELSEALTPSPVPDAVAGRSEDWGLLRAGFWRRLAEMQPQGLDAWSPRNAQRLAVIEAAAPGASAGETLLHCDLRADNLLLAGDRVYFVDWPWARMGAAWIDLVAMAPSVAMQGGPAPEELMSMTAVGRGAPPERVTAVVAAFAGYFVYQSLQPPPPGLPTVRAFQAAQGVEARHWLSRLTGLD